MRDSGIDDAPEAVKPAISAADKNTILRIGFLRATSSSVIESYRARGPFQVTGLTDGDASPKTRPRVHCRLPPRLHIPPGTIVVNGVHIPVMNPVSAPDGRSAWTLADFLSTYRYWALFLSSFFIALGGQGLTTMLPMIARTAAVSYETIGLLYVGINLGWVIGAFVAFIAASRSGWPALVIPLIISAAVAGGFLAMPAIWGSPVFLFVFGLAHGTVRALFPLAIAIFLVGGRPGKIDFGCALTLISTTILTSAFAPLGASMLYQLDESGTAVIIAFLACLLLAILVLLPARPLGFDDTPRLRHKPLAPQKRSAVMVALILFIVPLAALLMGGGIYALRQSGFENGGSVLITILPLLILVFAIFALVYFAWWVYRIHGELAGAAPSQRLLTPLAAMLIALLVPLGLPILLLTLADLINDRAREHGQRQLTSIVWLAIWSLLLPPVAIALIQNAANKSYDLTPA